MTMIENKESLIPKIDKSNWPDGPWMNEKDRYDFIASGYSCFILRNYSGVWCGYVGIDESHKFFGKDYNSEEVNYNLPCHGGPTYADFCSPPICHLPEPNMPERVWWFGFDCNHSGDYAPFNAKYNVFNENPSDYKDKDYAMNECKELAAYLRSIEK